MQSKIPDTFIRLFEEARTLSVSFQRESYERDILDQHRKYGDVFHEAAVRIQESPDKEETVKELAGVIPYYAKQKLSEVKEKRKKERRIMDYNMALVTYVLPVINYGEDTSLMELTEELVAVWNREVSDAAVKNSTYNAIKTGFTRRLCYITTAVCESMDRPDDCHELQVLRKYRDEYLVRTEEGRAVVEEYYDIAPTIVKRINKRADAKEIYRGIYEKYLVPCIRCAEEDKTEECREIYSSMVYELRNQYLYSQEETR